MIEPDAFERGGRLPRAQAHGDDLVWFVADPLSPEFGAVVTEAEVDGSAEQKDGPYCIARRPDGTAVLLRQARRSELRQLTVQTTPPGSHLSSPPASRQPKSRRCHRRAKLSQLDLFKHRPPMLPRRLLLGVVIFVVYIWWVSHVSHGDGPPSVRVPILVTLVYPPLISFAARTMEQRPPVQNRVFELLFAFDLYQFTASVVIAALVCREALSLGMVYPPWGHDASVTSPFLHRLVWWHYHNRILELLDTIFRISQKRWGTYGALHFYLRLVNMWSWFAAGRVGGGDVWFLTVVDALAVAMRFGCFTLSLLKWRWNPLIDFGMHAPKIRLLKGEHLYQLHLCEFFILAVHACYMVIVGNVPRVMAALQLLVMLQSAAVFTDWAHSHDDPEGEMTPTRRLMFSFDSSGWLYLYHFGVAMWIEDHIDIDGGTVGFSGSSGGALVGAALATGVEPKLLADFVLDEGHKKASRNPFLLMSCVEDALDKFLPKEGWAEPVPGERRGATGVLRVLLTRVSPVPPFVTGEVVSRFPSWTALFTVLRATCHIPGVGGLLPYPVQSCSGWYYDGLVWASLFVPWRTFHREDRVVKVSAFGAPGAHIGPSVFVPWWWSLLPPSADTLRGLMWLGYRDAEEFVEGRGKRSWLGCAGRCGGPPADSTRKPSGGTEAREAVRSRLRRSPFPTRLDEEARESCERLQREVQQAWRRAGVLASVASIVWALMVAATLRLAIG
eukprot:TRINITY_DN5347_c0_g1_i1.p1 TRINITY_DN5347_c0_g1~~TRINITY_DN5347_c0_g1_i1.p1  ORF type:complete len:743 (+),score=151.30 TRINITY_DN5347_c0_g1_i1:49-2229(+)